MADWDKGKPADSDLLSQFPANERAARGAVETNFGVDHHEADDADVGKHELVQMLAQVTPAAAAGEGKFYTKDVGAGAIELFYMDETGAEIQLTSRGAINDFPSGTKMLFYQAAAPTGWTQDTGVNDRVLRVVSGAGGGNGGSWTISGLTVDGHALTVSEMPSHDHGGATSGAGGHSHSRIKFSGGEDLVEGASGTGSGDLHATFNPSTRNDFLSTNSVGNHTHPISAQGGGATHNHGLTADGAWRPLYINVIAASKD